MKLIAEANTDIVGRHIKPALIHTPGGIGAIQFYGSEKEFSDIGDFPVFQFEIVFGFFLAFIRCDCFIAGAVQVTGADTDT